MKKQYISTAGINDDNVYQNTNYEIQSDLHI